MKYQDEVQKKFEEYNELYFNKIPNGLYEPIVYAMASGGKYIRPLLMMYAAELFDAKPQDVLLNAYGVELFHNFTLLHDDIMDNSEVRRGMPTVYKKFGLNAGILSGDLMLIKSLRIASKLDGKTNSDLFDLVSETAVKIHEGQQMDVDFEEMSMVDEKSYIKMIEYKTAVLLACSLQMGATIAGASYVDQKRIYEFGRLIGIAFQIQDDYLDAFGDAKVGKRIGGDILNNKKTLLFISSMALGTQKQQDELLSFFKSKKAKEEEKIAAVKAIFIESGGKTYCIKKMEELHKAALESLASLKSKNSSMELIAIADMIIKRKS
jgi:geranylgeranyl diphosphate synthase type II